MSHRLLIFFCLLLSVSSFSSCAALDALNEPLPPLTQEEQELQQIQRQAQNQRLRYNTDTTPRWTYWR